MGERIDHAFVTARIGSENTVPAELKKRMRTAIWVVGITVVLFTAGVYFFGWVPTIGVFTVYFYIRLKGDSGRVRRRRRRV
jgi:hypothetical protein